MSDGGAGRESRRNRRGGNRQPDGPRASIRALGPYLAEHRGILVAVIVLSVVGAVAQLGQPLLVSVLVGQVQAGRGLGILVWLVLALVVAAALISGVQHYLLQRAGTAVVRSARRRIVERVLWLPIGEYDRRSTGDLVSRVGADTTLLYAVLTQGLIDSVGGAFVFLGAVVGMFVLDPVLLLATVAIVLLSVLAVVAVAGRMRRASRRQQDRVGELAGSVERALGAIRTVRAANATDREVAAIKQNADRAYDAGVQLARYSALTVPVATLALQLALLVVLGLGGYRVASGATTVAHLVGFVMFLFLMVSPLGLAFGAVTSVSQALGALGRIQEVVELPSEAAGGASASGPAAGATAERTAPGALAPRVGPISFDGVHFAYDSGREVLHGVSFTAERGQRTALVGPSGAGKSTVLALIERFYEPSSGSIRLDGVDLRELDRTALRGLIGYVEQDAPVLSGTLRDNLLLAAPGAGDADCEAVLRRVNLGEVLDRGGPGSAAGSGLDTLVGEKGVMLSGGEQQRLAIARTLLAAQPILLLDEATASLDGRNEQLLKEALDAASADRTVIVIAHRLATVVDSDRIVVIEAGRVVGVGHHEELLASTPLYADLARRQLLA